MPIARLDPTPYRPKSNKYTDCKIQFRCTPQEKKLFRLAADEAGFRSLSEWVRVSAIEYIREHLDMYIKEKTTE